MKNIVIASAMCTALNAAAFADGIVEKEKPIYENRINFGLLSVGFDRIKTDSIYIGVDAKLTSIWATDNQSKSALDHFVNGEMRFGYTFLLDQKETLIPYVSLGFSVFSIQKKLDNVKTWNYGSFGFRHLHQFGEIFEMGYHIKGYHTIQQKIKTINGTKVIKDNRWMAEIGLPLVWHVGSEKNWEIQFEPYYLQIPNATRMHLVGSKLAFGFRF